MNNRCYSLSVALAPGEGIVARRDQSILYIPGPDERADVLLDAFRDGAVDEIWERLADTVVDQDFDVCAFACVTAAENIEIRVFGDVELQTDLRSVPMLSGAASKTWVEHRVHGHPHAAAITTGTAAVDERTGLVDGVVHAGGFTAALIEHHARQAATIDIPSSGPALTPAILVDDSAEGAAAADLAEIRPDEMPPGVTRPEAAAVENGQPADASDEPSEHSSELLTYVQNLPDDEDADSETTLAPDHPNPIVDDAAADTGGVGEPAVGSVVVSARVCKSGHANAPSRTACEVCDVFLPAGPDGVEQVSRPSLGTLLLDDGRSVDLTDDLAFGRNPSRSGEQWIPVVVEGDRVSRTHLTVRCDGWGVLIEDSGSHNGTVIVPADGEQPVALTTGTPRTIEPGATVYFGSSSFRFEGRKA